jgi:hypothetical protein
MGSDDANVESTVDKKPELGGLEDETVAAVEEGIQINAAGYRDQLKRQYNLLALAGVALTVDNAWAALGSSISVSIGEFSRIRSVLGRERRKQTAWRSTCSRPMACNWRVLADASRTQPMADLPALSMG